MEVETISQETGERTSFRLDLKALTGDEYLDVTSKVIDVIEYEAPDDSRIGAHGTTVTLTNLSLKQVPNSGQFAKSMARRFLLHQEQADFQITVNGENLPEAWDLAGVEYIFPRDYEGHEAPEGLDILDSGWGKEIIGGHPIEWRFLFHKDTINEEELRGIAIFAKGKMAQAPFLFNITGGLGGQHGVEYLAGQVKANFIDSLSDDVIATERQRVSWELDETLALLEWGRDRVKKLLKLWQDRRGAARARLLAEKLAGFSGRLEKLQQHERRTVTTALRRVAGIATLDDDQFEELGAALLTAWEQGRLQNLISDIANLESLSTEKLLEILVEAQVLSALNTAEAVKTKLMTLAGLKERIEKQELETAIRDYIAESPWMISPEWETFRKEAGVQVFIREVANEVGFGDEAYNGRMDLVLASGRQLLVLEFMRPGLLLNWEHLQRFELYIRTIRTRVVANTGSPFDHVTGEIVADGLERNPENLDKIQDLKALDMKAREWKTLIDDALAQWREFLTALVTRSPDDDRLRGLLGETQAGGNEPSE